MRPLLDYPIKHENVATALAITSTLKCKHIDSHYGIVEAI